MGPITNSEELRAAILNLEASQRAAWPPLRERFLAVLDHFRPGNIIKSTMKEIFGKSEVLPIVANSMLGITSGVVTDLLIRRSAANPVYKFLISAVVGAATRTTAGHSGNIVSFGKKMLGKLLRPLQRKRKASGELI